MQSDIVLDEILYAEENIPKTKLRNTIEDYKVSHIYTFAIFTDVHLWILELIDYMYTVFYIVDDEAENIPAPEECHPCASRTHHPHTQNRKRYNV